MAELTPTEKYQQYLRILKEDFTPIVKLEWLNPDGTVAFEVGNSFLQEGSLNVNFQNGTRRTANITLENTYRQNAINVNNIWFGQQIRLSMGLYLHDKTPFLIPQGVFYIKDPQETFEPSAKIISLPLVDKWAYLDGSLFGNLEGNYVANVNENIYEHIAAILKIDRGNGVPIDNVAPLLSQYFINKTTTTTLPDSTVIPWINTPYELRIESGKTYADVLLELNTMLTGIIGYNNVGQLTVEPSELDFKDISKPIQWTYKLTEKEFLGCTYDIPMSDVYNDVILIGANINGLQAKGRATNTNIKSDTCVQKIGRKTITETDSKYFSDTQCEDLATYKLKRMMILKESINFKSSPMYHFKENNLVEIYLQHLNDYKPEKYLVNGFTIPIAQSGEMIVEATCVNDIEI